LLFFFFTMATLSRGQILEAIQNVFLVYEITEQNWIDNKQKVLEAITRGVEEMAAQEGADHPVVELQNQRLLQKQEREHQWKNILEHWEGIEEDFVDLDKNFDLLGEVLAKARTYWEETTLKTTEALITRNDEIIEQGDKMKDIEARAGKVRTTQDRMKGMMESNGTWMGRIICPLLMGFCCCWMFASLTLGVVLRIGVQQGAWNISKNESFFRNQANKAYDEYLGIHPSPSSVLSDIPSPSPLSIHPNCTSSVHVACVSACDVHGGVQYKKCVKDCSAAC